MAKILQDSAPGFEPWPIEHYDPDVRSWVVISHRSAPSAVIGDFNGDGVQDVVMQGFDRTRVLRVCLLSTADQFRFLVLESGPRDPTLVDPGNSITYLEFQGPGRIGTNFTDESLILRTDAFERVFYGKAAVLYYWNGTKFVEFQTAD